MSEKTYDAIYKVAKNAESDIVLLWVGHSLISGILLDCEDNKCLNNVITLQDAEVKCMNQAEAVVKHFKWLNVPACHIQSFTFKCCVID